MIIQTINKFPNELKQFNNFSDNDYMVAPYANPIWILLSIQKAESFLFKQMPKNANMLLQWLNQNTIYN